MLSAGPNYGKLKTNLRLAVNRLKLLEKKKTELAQKARREIAEYISSGKYERAKIRVEHIIREDYLVEAMELVEMYCDLLLARFGLIQQMKILDEGLSEAISSVIWVTPRLQADVAELKLISDQLTAKYGKPYAQAARENALQSVNEKLVVKLSVQAPPRILVEKYMIEIAKSNNIPYEPDMDVMKSDEVLAADMMVGNQPLIDFGESQNGHFKPPNNFGGGGGGCPQSGNQPFNYPPQAMGNSYPEKPAKGFPPLPSMPPSGPYPGSASAPSTFNLPPAYDGLPPAPPYDSVVNNGPKMYPNVSDEKPKQPSDTLPELPAVPESSLPDFEQNSSEVDFDELTKRFEQLKKHK